MGNSTIYSSNFKKWFGDWESGHNCSKVVDNNGKPLPVYHGTVATDADGSPFKVFKTESEFGQGVMFADNHNVANFFSGGGNARFVNFKEKFEQWGDKDTIDGLLSFLNNVIADDEYKIVNNGNSFYRLEDSNTSSPLGEIDEEIYNNLLRIINNKIDYSTSNKNKGGVYKVYLNIRNPYIFDANGSQFDRLRTEFNDKPISVFALVSYVKELGKYDGVIVRNVRETTSGKGKLTNDYIVFKANQIKHALDNNGNFSNDSDDMTESRLRKYVRDIVCEAINEVRYIDTKTDKYSGKIYKNNWRDEYNQQSIKNNEKIRVFHGCSLETACKIAIQGTSGKEPHPRKYSFENGMNPLGIFVTTDFEVAKDFGNSNQGDAVIEFTASVSDLESPIWNGQDSYFTQGSNPISFKNSDERNAQKMKYRQDSKSIKDIDDYDFKNNKDRTISMSHVRDSDKPELARSIFMNREHQALFMGDLNPNMIKRIWVNQQQEDGYVHSNQSYQPMTVKEFIKKYGNKEWWVGNDNNYQPRYSKFRKEKLFNPNDDVNSFDDLIKASANERKDKSIENAKKNLDFMGFFENPPSQYAIDCMKRLLYPKQIIQLYGKEFFDSHFNRLGQ